MEEERRGSARLRVRRLDGTPVDRLGSKIRRWRAGLRLSPEEKTLRVGHSVRDDELDGGPPATEPIRRVDSKEIEAALVAPRPMLTLIDLASGGGIVVADGGHEGRSRPLEWR